MSYTKLFHRIITSSIWDEPNSTRIVWITMLAMANQDGYVGATFKSLAMLSRTTEEECRVALDTFLAPDANSSSADHEGRRIAKVEGGWVILNYERYRNAVSDDPNAVHARERNRRYREKLKNSVTETSRDVTGRNIAYASASEGGCKGGEGETIAKPDTRKAHGEFGRVKLTDEQYAKLLAKHGEARLKQGISVMDSWLESKGKTYKNYYAALKEDSWVWERIAMRPKQNVPHWMHKTTKGHCKPGFTPPVGKEADYEWIA